MITRDEFQAAACGAQTMQPTYAAPVPPSSTYGQVSTMQRGEGVFTYAAPVPPSSTYGQISTMQPGAAVQTATGQQFAYPQFSPTAQQCGTMNYAQVSPTAQQCGTMMNYAQMSPTAQQCGTVTYAQMSPSAQQCGTITSAQSRSPQTYAAAPSQATYSAAPCQAAYAGAQPQAVYAGAPSQAKYAGASSQATRTPTSQELLAMGKLVSEHYITRDELIRDEHLIADDQREAALVGQFMQRPGAVGSGGPSPTLYSQQRASASTTAAGNYNTYSANPGQTITSGLRPTERASYSATGGLTSVQPHGGSTSADRPELLEVSILHANNLHHQNMVGDHWYVTCTIKRRNGKAAHPKAGQITTNQIPKTLDPVWNELHHLEGWVQGDDLEFTVYDKGIFNSKVQGKVTLQHENFFPNGWEGEVPLEGAQGALLGVRVLPMQR